METLTALVLAMAVLALAAIVWLLVWLTKRP
jgi:hypothetical protein